MKHKMSNKDVMNFCQTDREATSYKAQVICEKPCDKIYQFDGVIKQNGKKFPLYYENFLLRGSSLRNTDWIYGVVTYTGHDTRIMRNSTSARAKYSRVEKQTNINIIFIFCLQLLLCLVATIVGTIWRNYYIDSIPYLNLRGQEDNLFDKLWYLNAVQRYGTWILLFT